MIIIRYADDTIIGFQHEHEATAFLDDLKERMREQNTSDLSLQGIKGQNFRLPDTAGVLGETINGTADDDILTGTSLNETINGGLGDDVIRARSGDDTVNGGSGEDLLRGESGDDIVDGGSSDDILRGNSALISCAVAAGATASTAARKTTNCSAIPAMTFCSAAMALTLCAVAAGTTASMAARRTINCSAIRRRLPDRRRRLDVLRGGSGNDRLDGDGIDKVFGDSGDDLLRAPRHHGRRLRQRLAVRQRRQRHSHRRLWQRPPRWRQRP